MTIISSRVPVPSLSFGRGEPPLEGGSLLEGERLGQFLLEKFVGGGGMGVVFRALDTTLNRQVAVKVLSRDQSADEETLRRFRNEAQSAARLNHENIAHVHYVGEDRGVHYIVFEFIEGVNIRDLVERNGPLPLDDGLSYTYQIAQALDHASQRAVIHRDIKPSNVLITFDGKAKLVDMGLARLNQVAHGDNDLTASGVTLGTFDYISPEQARDPRSADVRSDMYSLGCSFFYMLTGRPPFPEGTVLQKLLQHQADHPPDPRAARPELPAEITHIVARLLAKAPAQRYQHPAELIDELAALGDKLGMQLSASRPHPAGARSLRPMAHWLQHLPWAGPLAALFVIVIGLDFYWSSGSGEVAPPAPQVAAGRLPQLPRRDPKLNLPAPPAAEQIPPIEGPLPTGGPSATGGPLPPVGQADSPAGESAAIPRPKSTLGAETGDGRPFWESILEPFGGRNLEQLKARVSEAAKEAAASSSDSNEVPVDPFDTTAGDLPTPPHGPAIGAPATRENLLVVGDETAPHAYASLHAACSDAKSGDTIELRYSGRRLEKPIVIADIKLTIRAGEGHQPVVVFRPEPDLVPLKYPPTMLSVAGGQLLVTGVHWELDLPRNVPSDWALFETRRAELLQFRKCTFTVRNASLGQTAYHAGVAFFDIKALAGNPGMDISTEAMEEQIVTINLQHCLARGEATFLRCNELQAVRLNWDNGLLATSERLLVAAGGPSQPKQPGHVQLNLRHVTAMVHGGLAMLANSQDAPYQLPTEINCDDSIFVSTARPPLVEQRGSNGVQDYEARLQWSGNRDVFDGFDVFWQIVSTATQTASLQMRFEAWQSHWGSLSRGQLIRGNAPLWRAPAAADRPFHAHLPDDYLLSADVANNPALGAASDGSDIGCQLRQLPALMPPNDDTRP